MALKEACYRALSPGLRAIAARVRATQYGLDDGAERNAEKTTTVKSGQLGIWKSSGPATGRRKRFEEPNTGRGGSKFSLATAILIVSYSENTTEEPAP